MLRKQLRFDESGNFIPQLGGVLMKISTHSLVTAFMLGVSLTAIATPVLAQSEDSDKANGGLEEIIVTAQKREQNLQAVPIAVSAIGADKVEQLGIKDARDLSGLAPNVTVAQGTTNNTAAVFAIRGIAGGASEGFSLDSGNALYVDGVYVGRAGGRDIADIERIEVLRGPQGTLFGRNTTGGAIQFISRKPSETFRLHANVGYGNFQAWNGKIILDPGAIAGISTSFSYSHGERNGVVDNILQADKSRDPGARKSDAFRAAARADLGSTGSIQYIFDWTKNTGSPINFQLTNTSDGAKRAPMVINGQSIIVTQPAPVTQLLAGATFLQAGCAALAAPTRVYRDQVCNDVSNNAVDKLWGHNLQVQNSFGDVSVKSTTGYRFWQSDLQTDFDGIGAFRTPLFTNASLFNGMPASLLQFIPSIPAAARGFIAGSAVPTVQQNLYNIVNSNDHKQFSQELEFSGTLSHLDWVAGGFYFWENGKVDSIQNSGYALDTNSVFLGSFGPLGPSFVAANPARYRMVQTLSTSFADATNSSKALYGQFTYHPGGRDSGLRLTAGARYTWDKKELDQVQNGGAQISGSADFEKFTWNLMVGYDLSDDITSYARVATGYRSGGFNGGDPDPVTKKLVAFKPENLISYEVGLKTELFDRRLRFNLAAFHNIYKDLAVVVPSTTAAPGTFATIVGNAGKVEYTGIEAEMQAKLSDTFSIDGSLGYVSVNYKELLTGQSTTSGAPAVNVASITKPSYVSPLTANIALNAQIPLNWRDARAVIRVGYTYEDGKYSFVNSISAPFNEEIKGDNRNVIDAQISIDRIALGSAEGEIKFWAKNITNSHDIVRGIDFGPLGYAGAFYADPATYGVTVGVKF
jgi:iron complex outermembrane receptor protein